MKRFAFAAALAMLAAPAFADDPLVLSIKDHRFQPDRLEIPADTKVKLTVRNLDSTAEEFESYDLNREKVVAAGSEITVFIGPLAAGNYKFFGDFHQDTAQGVIVAR
jgi:hypothetical protein